MIVPSTSDVLQTIAKQFDDVIVPSLENLRERSCATTMRHLLRHVGIRIELEGPLLFAEEAELRRVLGRLAESLVDVTGLDVVIAGLHAALAQQRDPSVYPSVAVLSDEVGRLRGQADTLLAALRALPAADRSEATAEAHEQLRAYISWQIQKEAKIVEPSFVGFGPRR